jgi:hypothetical protein
MAEKPVLLEAIAAPPVMHELLLKRLDVQPHRPSQQWIQILERNRLGMPRVNTAQDVECRRALPRVADSVEVSIKIERLSGHNRSLA